MRIKKQRKLKKKFVMYLQPNLVNKIRTAARFYHKSVDKYAETVLGLYSSWLEKQLKN